MTAHATIEERQRCLAAGMNDHISKPIDPGLLFETVGRYYKPDQAIGIPERRGDVSPHGSVGAEKAANSLPPPGSDQAKQSEADAPLNAEDPPSINGLDTKDGLTRVAGNRKLYLKLLSQFAEQQGRSAGQITDALSHGDVALAERLAHTLKGVAGNIGAKTVQNAAGALEKLIRERAGSVEVNAAIGHVTLALDPLVAQLQTAFSSRKADARVETPAAPPMNPEQTRGAAAQLLKLLSDFDSAALDFFEANRAVLGHLFSSDTWPEFERHVEGYAFADAQVLLEQAITRFPPGEETV
jgi:HPt (histidine-containing phosphotransfer) domain-containing protein